MISRSSCPRCGANLRPGIVRSDITGERLAADICEDCHYMGQPTPVGVDRDGQIVPIKQRRAA